jgi:hypothetical protein
VLVEGLDQDGDAVMDNLGLPDDDEQVEVVAGSSQELVTRLEAAPARVNVTMQVFDDNNIFQMCGQAPASFFEVQAVGGTQTMLIHQFDYCEGTQQPMPDPDRVIDGTRLNNLVVSALDANEDELGSLPPETFDPPGAGKTVELVITCHGADCEATVSGGASSDDGGSGGDESGSGG